MQTNQRAARTAMAMALVALGCLALTAVVTETTRPSRTVLFPYADMDSEHNPFLGTGKGGFAPDGAATSDPEYDMEGPDEPGRPGAWNWATTEIPEWEDAEGETHDGYTGHGHGADWIYQGGGSPCQTKGPQSYYCNQWALDMSPRADLTSERSNPDHSTTQPYTASYARETIDSPMATDAITGTDGWLSQSNGIY
mmetsp:Transcript_36910/g.72017  ORF Transcript_36910/g.72017 Transcript_36910/m.72017 type:complete len:196 (-) Transcript_36910:218-805(-)